MSPPALNLVVIRVPDIEAAQRFYSALGLVFTKHAHGKGPAHYASEDGPVVFEIYPQASSEDNPRAVRIGFKVDDVVAVVALAEKSGGKNIAPAKPSPWGLRAVMEDPFGHKIELIGNST